ncbi:MAG: vacuolar family H+-ATPase subunit H [Lachnospiraceae bacterium]|nr:vacuolar family H+-ATPase subunit H [Lachnospiraceae bacterium]
MSSKIEQVIEEIEDYIDNCKYRALSSTIILVNKEEIDELLHELKVHTPDEIQRYKKIVDNKDAIMDDARQKADSLVRQAQAYTDQMINEHTIMQQAYQQASEIVNQAKLQAQEIIGSATAQANEIQLSAMQYTDGTLANLQALLSQSISVTKQHNDSLIEQLNRLLTVVNADRAEMHPAIGGLDENEAIAERAEAERNLQVNALVAGQEQEQLPADAPVPTDDDGDVDLSAPL